MADLRVHPAASELAERFASLVAGQLDGGILRYTQRRWLLGQARRWGIGRFEANLIVAAVQHQRGDGGLVFELPPRRSLARRIGTSLAAFAVIQSGIVGIVAWLLGGENWR
jgi:hypothetical protein